MRTTGLVVSGVILLALLTTAGCGDAVAPGQTESAASVPAVATPCAFDPAASGVIKGCVLWSGARPEVRPFEVWPNPNFSPPWPEHQPPRLFANPNAPVIDKAGGVGNAIIFLRGVDPARARPWPYPPVTVAVHDYRMAVRQGDAERQVGFVRRGDLVRFASDSPRCHIVQATGSAFFRLTLPTPTALRTRPMPNRGLVELADGAQYYWLRAYLFVDEQPYYTHCQADGSFRLEQVPSGDYDLVAWLPNWHEAGHERDPEAGVYSRLFFRPAVEVVQRVHIGPGQTTSAEFHFESSQFSR